MTADATVAVVPGWPGARTFAGLLKVRITEMVLVATTIGYLAGARSLAPLGTFVLAVGGTALVSAGAGVLNSWLETDVDARMHRTRHRPLPSGRIGRTPAALFGFSLIGVGAGVLFVGTNALAAGLSLAAAGIYAGAYTPLKRITWLNTPVGAVPGAIPPLIGWAAATGNLAAGAWALFVFLFLWQHPHFYAIAWMYRDDYRRGGLRMLSLVGETGNALAAQVVALSVLLLPVSLLPVWLGLAGSSYMIGVALLGIGFVAVGVSFARRRTFTRARVLLKASVIYLPAVLVLLATDVIISG